MKKIYLLFIFIIFCSFLFADIKIDRIAIVNLDQVVNTVFPDNSSILKYIKIDKQDTHDKLNKIKNTIIKLENDKTKEKEEQNKQIIQKKIDELKKEYNDFYKQRIFKEIYTAIKKIAETMKKGKEGEKETKERKGKK